jgi:CYTH domain-containing protein
VEQGYLAIDQESEVRVRQIGDQGFLTVKRGSGRSRLEEEVEIAREQLEQLWPMTKGLRIKKRRYAVPLGRLTAEVDVYEGELEGLITVEVEFDSLPESERFDPPGWFGREVTDDPRYSNQALSVHGKPAEAG